MRISDWSSDVCSSDLLGGLEKARDGAQNCRLAAPRRPQEAEELAVFDLEVRVLDCGEFAEANRDVIELYVGAHLSRPPLVPSLPLPQIGRASCRERVCQYVSISLVAVSLKKKNNK